MTRQLQLLGASFAALTLAVAGVAHAGTFIQPWTTSANGDISVTIGDNGLGVPGGADTGANGNTTHSYDSHTGIFTDTFNFFLPTGFASASAITTLSGVATNDLTFTGITFNGAAGTTASGGGTATAHVGFQPVSLGGEQQLIITGTGGPAATYGGTVSFVLSNGVPEPATWALMIVGFGGAGALLRKRRHAAAVA